MVSERDKSRMCCSPFNDNEPDMRECEVCALNRLIDNFPRLQGCFGESLICRECTAERLSTRIGNTLVMDDMNCPCPSKACKATITYNDVRRYATYSVFQQYVSLCPVTS